MHCTLTKELYLCVFYKTTRNLYVLLEDNAAVGTCMGDYPLNKEVLLYPCLLLALCLLIAMEKQDFQSGEHLPLLTFYLER